MVSKYVRSALQTQPFPFNTYLVTLFEALSIFLEYKVFGLLNLTSFLWGIFSIKQLGFT